MILLGCKPNGRFIEQHDIFFGIGHSLKELVPAIIASWLEAPRIHIDAWREVTSVNGYSINILPTTTSTSKGTGEKLFFLNLGGYKKDEFEEYHYRMIVVGKNKASAIQQAKVSAFYKHTGFKGADSHIDDKYGVDVDDFYEIEDILPADTKNRYAIHIMPTVDTYKDEWHLGYTRLEKLV